MSKEEVDLKADENFISEIKESQQKPDVWKSDSRFKVVTEKIRFGSPHRYEKWLKSKGIDYVVKSSTESTHFVFELYSVRFIHSSRFPSKYLHLFKTVRKDVLTYLEHAKEVYMPPKNNPIKFNYDYVETKTPIVGTDINHAYWRIAYKKGFITKKTYEKGLQCPSKALLQATLSVLGRKRYYTAFREGRPQERICTDEGDEKLRNVYEYIRLTCYNIMNDISELLGNDFDCYKTDAIYYKGTKKNIKIVQGFLDDKGLTYKQLDYFDETEEE